jgi:hypothetical protein
LEAAKFLIFQKGEKMLYHKKHELKTDPYVFEEVFKDNKTFEIRYNDRNFEVNDILILKETKYTGDEVNYRVLSTRHTDVGIVHISNAS